jgi:hypothetical protein
MGLNMTVPGLYIVHCKCGNALRWRSQCVCVLGHKFGECNSLLTTVVQQQQQQQQCVHVG